MNRLLKRRSTWPDLLTLQQEINQLFQPMGSLRGDARENVVSDWSPAIDIKDEPTQYVIKADIPGVETKDVEVYMESNNMLVIKGHKEHTSEEKEEDFVRIERTKGSFIRSFYLPDSVDSDKIKANSKLGVLTVMIPKAKSSATRKINIET